MIIILTALALAGAPQERPYQHTAQCLAEVAAMTYETMDMADPVMVAAAIAKTDRLIASHQDNLNAQAGLDAANAALVASMRVEEAAGKLPPGSADLTAEQHRQHRVMTGIKDRQIVAEAPHCQWPTEANEH